MTTNPREVALDQVLHLVDIFSRDMARRFDEDGPTPARTHLLWVLYHSGPSTGRALADHLQVTPRNVTGLVDGLVADGMVDRLPHPTDRRAKLICLTAEGSALMARMARDHQDLADTLFAPLADAELSAFTTTVTGLTERLSRAIADSGGKAS